MSDSPSVDLLIDTDPGVDDAHAILMASRHPRARIRALCTVHGNVSLADTTRNALVVAELAGIEAPVFAGAAQPLLGRTVTAADVHGGDGLGGQGRDPVRSTVEAEHASLAMIRLSREFPGQLTFVMLGPLTNLALALSLDPDLPTMVQRLVVMGGAVRATGNLSATAEFNVLADPEAASVVVTRWPSMQLVTWEATLAHPIPSERFDDILSGRSDRADFLRAVYASPRAFVEREYGTTDVLVPDPLAMAVALEPGIVSRQERTAIEVELGGLHTRGQTVVVPARLADRAPNIGVVEAIEQQGLETLLEFGNSLAGQTACVSGCPESPSAA